MIRALLAVALVLIPGCGLFTKTFDPEYDYVSKVVIPREILEYHGKDEQVTPVGEYKSWRDVVGGLFTVITALSDNTVGQISAAVVGVASVPADMVDTGFEKSYGRAVRVMNMVPVREIKLQRGPGGPVLTVSYYESGGTQPEPPKEADK